MRVLKKFSKTRFNQKEKMFAWAEGYGTTTGFFSVSNFNFRIQKNFGENGLVKKSISVAEIKVAYDTSHPRAVMPLHYSEPMGPSLIPDAKIRDNNNYRNISKFTLDIDCVKHYTHFFPFKIETE